jgi:hypothetical protein
MSKDFQQTSSGNTESFNRGMNKDSDPSYVQDGSWINARNAVNNTEEGEIGSLTNESSNFLCATTGIHLPGNFKYIIGQVHLFSDKWVVFTVSYSIDTNNTSLSSEIGLFEENTCSYKTIVIDPCLKFNKLNLISGASREKEDCSWEIVFADGLNPDRIINIGDPLLWPSKDLIFQTGTNLNYYIDNAGNQSLWPGIAWKQVCTPATPCEICENINQLDCDKIRLAKFYSPACATVSISDSGGSLRNGSYFAIINYSIKGNKIGDFSSPSNVQPIWYPDDLQGSLEINVQVDDEAFDEYELIIVSTINQNTVAKKIGIYSTNIKRIVIDQIKEDLISVPIEQLPIQTPVYEKSNFISEVNGYLLRVGPTSKFDFNYQPLANLVRVKWVSTEYDADYYVKGGTNPSFLRDENYSLFIRWIYNTGDKTSAYHIPGRPPVDYQGQLENSLYLTQDSLTDNDKLFEVINTASITALPNEVLPDGGIVVAEGLMGYHESTESYPDNKPEIWNSSSQCWTGTTDSNYDLCGKAIRHHKFPENFIIGDNSDVVNHFKINSSTGNSESKIRILGIKCENIIYPKDNEGNDIPGIIGYEILRGSREGNKTIIAKGMINNLRTYRIKGNAANGQTGLYPNYPFNTIKTRYSSSSLSDHNYNFNDPYIKITDEEEVLNQNIPTDVLTFHSPDTNFRNPFLSPREYKTYGVLKGKSFQKFITPSKHPKHKLVSDISSLISFAVGIAEMGLSLRGTITTNNNIYNSSGVGGDASYAAAAVSATAMQAAQTAYNIAMQAYFSSGGAIVDGIASIIPFVGFPISDGINTTLDVAGAIGVGTGAVSPNNIGYTTVLPKHFYGDPITRTFTGIQQALLYFSEGADTALRVIYALIPYSQYALQHVSHGFYDNMSPVLTDVKRYKIEESFYLKNNFQKLADYYNNMTGVNYSYSINNLNRQNSVLLRTKTGSYYDPFLTDGANKGPNLLNIDKSLVTLGNIDQDLTIPDRPTFENPNNPFSLPIGSYYGAIKNRLRNQYGQINSIKLISIPNCNNTFDYTSLTTYNVYSSQCQTTFTLKRINTTPVIFGGDTYINRYTEKNFMLFFYDWLYGQPDGTEFNYYQVQNVPEPRFWANTTKYDTSYLSEAISDISNPTPSTGVLPTRFYNLDNKRYDYTDDTIPNVLFGPLFPNLIRDYPGLFRPKDSYFYLGNMSVRDFYVESDVLVDFRESREEIYEQHYDPYKNTDLERLFEINPKNVTQGNFYAYDYSLSISKLFTQYYSQGNLQSSLYNPLVSELCYTYYPDRIIYSLPQQEESFKQSWLVYLANNYKEFKSQISSVKNFAKTGLFITFKNDSPLVYQGVDSLQTDLGTKVTLGDGGLFSQAPQNVVIADKPYEYGSSQNRLSVINTPAGMFYMGQNQAKIFNYAGGLKEISQKGMKWWFNLFLPYKILEDFPEYIHTDNPIVGVGCQSIYDNKDSVLFFSKKDYKLKADYKDRVTYNSTVNRFLINGEVGRGYALGDSLLFDNASWTISYDPKNESFISFHDWYPDLVIPTTTSFLSTKFNGIWKHNNTCGSYCNFYGVDYPFEVEFPYTSGQQINTLRSFEYILESYKRNPLNCSDQYHLLDHNFDTALIYNSEQISGILNLNPYPKNNPSLSLQYPIINNNSIDILYSKEENKYRFNQFWDITFDRGEFPIDNLAPTTAPVIPGTTELLGNYNQEFMFNTQPNGYIRDVNTPNLNYTKAQLERKKFRHYTNFIKLTKEVCGDVNMIIKIVNNKNLYSPR